jgi:hypothetical protein
LNAAPRHVVTRQVVLEVIGPHGVVPAEAELRYDPLDPYAVAVAFRASESEITWVFGRDLLMRGLSEPVGEGDVRVAPSLDPDGRAVVVLMLRAPSGDAVVELAARDVLGFLARSTRAVWPGTESDYVSADAAIASILVGD